MKPQIEKLNIKYLEFHYPHNIKFICQRFMESSDNII